MAAEPVNGAEHPQEYFLRQVQRFVAVAQEVHRQLDDHALVLGDQLGTRQLLAGGTPLDERRFAAPDIRPTCDAGLFH